MSRVRLTRRGQYVVAALGVVVFVVADGLVGGLAAMVGAR